MAERSLAWWVVSEPSFQERLRTTTGPYLEFLGVGSFVLILVLFILMDHEDLSDRIVSLFGDRQVSLDDPDNRRDRAADQPVSGHLRLDEFGLWVGDRGGAGGDRRPLRGALGMPGGGDPVHPLRGACRCVSPPSGLLVRLLPGLVRAAHGRRALRSDRDATQQFPRTDHLRVARPGSPRPDSWWPRCSGPGSGGRSASCSPPH